MAHVRTSAGAPRLSINRQDLGFDLGFDLGGD